MSTNKRLWLKTFGVLLLLIPGLPYVILALAYLFNHIGLQGMLSGALSSILHAYCAVPAQLFGEKYFPKGYSGYGTTTSGIIIAAILYSLIAFALAFPISKAVSWIRAKTSSQTEKPKSRSLKNRLLRIIVFILVLWTALYALKHLRIRYALYRYKQIQTDFFNGGSVKEFLNQANPLGPLHDLGYLVTYELPIENPKPDAEAYLEPLTLYLINHNIPTQAWIDTFGDQPMLMVSDRPGQKENWKKLIRLYLEQHDPPLKPLDFSPEAMPPQQTEPP